MSRIHASIMTFKEDKGRRENIIKEKALYRKISARIYAREELENHYFTSSSGSKGTHQWMLKLLSGKLFSNMIITQTQRTSVINS